MGVGDMAQLDNKTLTRLAEISVVLPRYAAEIRLAGQSMDREGERTVFYEAAGFLMRAQRALGWAILAGSAEMREKES